VSAVLSGSSGSILEALGRGYLGLLLFMAAAHVKDFGLKRLYSLWIWGTVMVSVVAVTAYGAALFDVPFCKNWVAKIPDYPYFGDLYRLRGSGQTYGMFFMLLLPGYFMAFNHWREDRIAAWPVLIVLAAAFLTFGKEILLIPIGHLLLLKGSVAWPKVLAAGLVMVLLAATHFLLVDKDSKLSSTAYVNRSVAEVNDYRIMETNYTENKRAAVLIFSRNPVWGVGPGQFSRSTVQLVEEGRYPEKFGRFDPHSAWTGAMAETGTVGFLFLCLLLGCFFWARPVNTNLLAVLLILFLIASIFKDIMNFRAVWLLLGLFAAKYIKAGSSEKEQIGLPSPKF
jgi:hypothetical protein